MTALADLQAQRAALVAARNNTGVRRYRDSNGEEVEYRSDSEMRSALAALDQDIAPLYLGRAPPSSHSPPAKGSDPMKNFVQRGDNITLAAPATVTSGAPVLVNSLFGIAAGDAASGASVDLVTVGVFDLAKVSTDTFAVGEVVYWDDSASLCTSDDDSAANPRVGLAVAAAANPSSIVRVRLDG